MRTTAWLPGAAIFFAVLLFTGCGDPTGVGLGLIDEESGEPRSLSLTLEYEPDRIAPITGGAGRVLVGTVTDPFFDFTGTAHGYIDFRDPGSDETFEDETIEQVTLNFSPDYVYGDSLSDITFQLREMPEEWDPVGAPADTVLEAGDIISEYTISARDSVVSLDLPQEWITENESVLRDTAFTDRFHGFKLEAESGNAIIGFGVQSASLTVRSEERSRAYLGTTEHTHSYVDAPDAPNSPPERTLIQDATGYAASFHLELPDTLEEVSVSRALLQFGADTTTLAEEVQFTRPALDQLHLSLLQRDTVRYAVSIPFQAEGRYATQDPTLRQLLQELLVTGSDEDGLQFRVQPSPLFGQQALANSMDSALLFTEDSPDCPVTTCEPRLLLTIIVDE